MLLEMDSCALGHWLKTAGHAAQLLFTAALAGLSVIFGTLGAAVPAETGLGLSVPDAGPVAHTGSGGPIDDPHDMPCFDCHTVSSAGAPEERLRSGDDSVSLCEGCHSRPHAHPVNVALPATMRDEAGVLPLGQGELSGRIVCQTCHRLHPKKHQRYLLRTADQTKSSRLLSLCKGCHGGDLEGLSPHQRKGGTCHFCHVDEPKAGKREATISSGVQAACDFCHDAVGNQHFRAMNPFNEEGVFLDPDPSVFPRINGRYTCVTCHDPHGKEGRGKLLREAYLSLAALSRKVNPHVSNMLCVSCHSGEPVRGQPLLREGGDLFRLCYRCHATRYTRSYLLHPVSVFPSPNVTVPSGMPLGEGRITCATCHESCRLNKGGRDEGERELNPNFLRGGITTRAEFCLRCHARGLASLVRKPHEQRGADGKIDRAKCLLCHSLVPEGRVGWQTLDFRLDPTSVNGLCLMCHSGKYQEAHPQVNHFVSPSDDVLEALETAADRVDVSLPLVDETVVCITCHDPHQEGLLAAEGEADAPLRGRLQVGWEICRACHLGA